MKVVSALIAVIALVAMAALGSQQASLRPVFGIVVPYAALALFVGGFIYRVVSWSRAPVPFRIPTTCGQHKSLDWIKPDQLDNPHSTAGVIGRMALEILLFRSLFRNTTLELHPGPKVVYASNKWLWLGGLAFHYSFLLILLRHLRFFTEPVPSLVLTLQAVDGFMEIGVPVMYVTSLTLLIAVTYLLARRLYSPQLRYLSLANDYFPLLLILGIGGSGVLLRHFVRTDIVSVKELTLSLLRFEPSVPDGVDWLFFTHLFLVCVLFAYFPFSKLMHLGGVFLSPTRNLASNNRRVRHINPWASPANLHSYAAYEDEFRAKMIQAGIPVEKEVVDEQARGAKQPVRAAAQQQPAPTESEVDDGWDDDPAKEK
jgi:nitrate reductase gamma subunit